MQFIQLYDFMTLSVMKHSMKRDLFDTLISNLGGNLGLFCGNVNRVDGGTCGFYRRFNITIIEKERIKVQEQKNQENHGENGHQFMYGRRPQQRENCLVRREERKSSGLFLKNILWRRVNVNIIRVTVLVIIINVS
ncbi:hypothetical protein Avbf_14979 [Armadillidium vulgare]|nr:hypothetical protein Avbf_14979 [Armadillidium vulgare]